MVSASTSSPNDMSALKHFIRKHWRNTVYSNVWIALGAAAITLQSLWVIGKTNWWIPTFVGLSTLFTYNFQRLVKLSERPEYVEAGRNNWLFRNRRILAVVTIFAGFGSLALFFRFDFLSMALLVGSGILSVLYAVRLGKLGSAKALRDLPYLKLYLIGIVWMISTTLIPLVHSSYFFVEYLPFLLERIAFIIAITIPFDIRDIALDTVQQRTVPQLVGIPVARRIANVWLGIAAASSAFLCYLNLYDLTELIGLLISYIVSGVLIVNSSPDKDEMYFTGWIDGVILLQALLVILL